MPYNISAAIASQNLVQLSASTVGILGGYWVGYVIIFILAFVTFVTLKSKMYSGATCFASAAWMVMLVALLLRPMGLIDNLTFWWCVLSAPIAAFALFMSGNAD